MPFYLLFQSISLIYSHLILFYKLFSNSRSKEQYFYPQSYLNQQIYFSNKKQFTERKLTHAYVFVYPQVVQLNSLIYNKHNNRLRVLKYYITSTTMPLSFQSQIKYSQIILPYQITMFALWGVGVDFARLLVRYAKSYPMVITIHNICMMIVGLMTLLYVITKTVLFYTQNFKLGENIVGVDLAQFILAWILCGCIIIQFGMGFRLRYEMVVDKLSTEMFSLKRSHRYIGTFMSILGKVVVALTLYPIQQSQRLIFKTWLFICGFLILIFIILEVFYRVQTRSIMLKFPLKHQSKYRKYLQEILENINSSIDEFPDYKQFGVRYVILDNKMYYIDENFIHPGGEHIFSIYNGQEVNYLFRGTHGPYIDFPRHNHTKYAINYLQERLIGEIKCESILLNYNENSEEIVQWRLTAIEQMEGDSNLVQFEADGAYIRQRLSIENFGKYMMISCPSQEIIGKSVRPYTLLISCCNQQQNILSRFKDAYKYYYMSENSGSSLEKIKKQENLFDVNDRKSALTFCIKKYKHGLFTKFMFSSQTDRTFKVRGPYGRGLRLKPKSNGYYIMIAAGTGVLPYIDFFYFLLQKTLLNLIKERAGDNAARKVNEQRYQYENFENTKILFIGSFQSSKHFYMSEVVKDLHHLSMKHQINFFDMRLRYNSGENEPGVDMIGSFFDRKFIEELLKKQPDRIYYCGPSSIQQILRKVERENNIETKFIYL